MLAWVSCVVLAAAMFAALSGWFQTLHAYLAVLLAVMVVAVWAGDLVRTRRRRDEALRRFRNVEAARAARERDSWL